MQPKINPELYEFIKQVYFKYLGDKIDGGVIGPETARYLTIAYVLAHFNMPDEELLKYN